ncbi:hypothetical protein [Nostoc sp. FACHB-133]|uniref:hypothetical protein n=1 Tax=Nostoc sp. FACHB-133 TaxID=2692835 RepID=UPI001684F2EA|nr:hypothetical protein [Nostoc sp. FACHB-133]MBD2525686.1 hypothetical protein [Nostoc sp. FACHB-133]
MIQNAALLSGDYQVLYKSQHWQSSTKLRWWRGYASGETRQRRRRVGNTVASQISNIR